MLLKSANKKGQAAFEFMVTYGWAILLVMGSIAALTYFMPNSKSLTENRCIFSPATPCLGTRLTNSNLTIILQNGLGQTIYNVKVNVTTPKIVVCNVSNSTLRAEQRLEITCKNNGTMNLTKDTKIKMLLTYKKTKTGYDQISLGDVYAKYK